MTVLWIIGAIFILALVSMAVAAYLKRNTYHPLAGSQPQKRTSRGQLGQEATDLKLFDRAMDHNGPALYSWDKRSQDRWDAQQQAEQKTKGNVK
ncbi:MAG: hypothetical protein ACI8R4_000781 [Paracoccaceae bacterium]|jgi:hypothetical protein